MPLPRPDDADYQALLDVGGDPEMSPAECSRLQQQLEEDQAASGEHQVKLVDKARRSKLSEVAGYIILTEFCERLAYYGFSGRFPNACLVCLVTVRSRSNVKNSVRFPRVLVGRRRMRCSDHSAMFLLPGLESSRCHLRAIDIIRESGRCALSRHQERCNLPTLLIFVSLCPSFRFLPRFLVCRPDNIRQQRTRVVGPSVRERARL